jgi:hypothetical protein
MATRGAEPPAKDFTRKIALMFHVKHFRQMFAGKDFIVDFGATV